MRFLDQSLPWRSEVVFPLALVDAPVSHGAVVCNSAAASCSICSRETREREVERLTDDV